MTKAEDITLETIHNDLKFVKSELIKMNKKVNEIKDMELNINPEYVKKITKIREQKGKIYHSISNHLY